jgi:hypothetical protein
MALPSHSRHRARLWEVETAATAVSGACWAADRTALRERAGPMRLPQRLHSDRGGRGKGAGGTHRAWCTKFDALIRLHVLEGQ